MCIRTAATTSSGWPSTSGTSSSGVTVTSGTLIMIFLLVIWESAVAACPAPMFATSLRGVELELLQIAHVFHTGLPRRGPRHPRSAPVCRPRGSWRR